mgnify:CR=1 FL=1
MARVVGNRKYSAELMKRFIGWNKERNFPYERYMRKNRCVFIHVPKAAGTSVRRTLGAPERGRRHLPWYVYYSASPERFNRYFKFAVVREPAERILSGYLYLREGGNGREDLDIAEYVRSFDSFYSFVVSGLAASPVLHHPLFRSQASYLCDWRGDIQVDFLGRCETISEDFKILSKRIPAMRPLSVSNRSSDTVGSLDRLGTKERKVLLDLYHVDYEVLGYRRPVL